MDQLPDPLPQPPIDARASRRLRQRINVMMHPDTIDRLDSLCRRYQCSRGHVVDRVVAALYREHQTDTCHCAHGERCPSGRRDVPSI